NRENLTDNQKKFLQAYKAVKANDRPLIAKYQAELKDYSLAPYIRYLDYSYHLKDIPPAQIEQFIHRHPSSPLPRFLKRKWLKHLGRNKDWTSYLKHYQPGEYSNKDLTCYYYRAQIQQTPKQFQPQPLQTLWQENATLPNACSPLESYLRKHQLITGSMVWAKASEAMRKGHTKTARRIGRDLSKQDQKALNYWIDVYRHPNKVTNTVPAYVSPVIRKSIFKQGIQRLAYSDPEKALETLKSRGQQYGLSAEEEGRLQSRVSLRFAYQYHPKASEYLAEIDRAAKDERTLEWEMQLAIRESEWVNYLDIYRILPSEQQQESRWRYWQARALSELKHNQAANPIFKDLAQERSFYGFLSADRLNLPYQFNPSPSDTQDIATLMQKYPQLEVMQELIAIDWKISLNREWYHLLKQLDRDDFEAIAVFMAEREQHNLAIQTVSRVQKWDDLSLRFPTPYKEPIMQAADKNTLDPAWVYGVIRRESAFSPDISSPVGAIGLMQVMPKTARYIGRKIGLNKRQYTRLTIPESNIELGSAYLGYLSEKYNGNRVLATAAYNAGPSRVDKWIPDRTQIAADQWIDTIPFSETRAYVKAVMEYTTIFKSMLNKKYDRLENFMHPIGHHKTLSQTETRNTSSS
ncbi:MAG: transglycosylase SLT domain-containing protein, partial [Hydrogenovibrio sp.]